MSSNFEKVAVSAQQMADSVIARLPSLIVAIIAFLLFYFLNMQMPGHRMAASRREDA